MAPAVGASPKSLPHSSSGRLLGDAGNPRRVPMMRVSPEFFATLGVPLALGQPFKEENLAYKADEVAILTDEFWRGHFNAATDVLGRTFNNDGVRISVIGVLPPSFRFLSSQAQFFRPSSHAPEDRRPSARHSNQNWNMVVRLAPGVDWKTAQVQMDAFNALQLKNDPIREVVQKIGYRSQVASLHQDHVREVKRTLALFANPRPPPGALPARRL